MAAKKFKSLSKMAEYMTNHPLMQREVVMSNGQAFNTSYLKGSIKQIDAIEVKAMVGEVPTPLERLGLEMLMQIFEIEWDNG